MMDNDVKENFDELEDHFLPLLKMELEFNSNFINFFDDVVKKQKESEAQGLTIDVMCKYEHKKITFFFKLVDYSDLKAEINVETKGDGIDDEYIQAKFPIYHRYNFKMFRNIFEFFEPKTKVILSFVNSQSNGFGLISLTQNPHNNQSITMSLSTDCSVSNETIEKRIEIMTRAIDQSEIKVTFDNGMPIFQVMSCVSMCTGLDKPGIVEFYYRKKGLLGKDDSLSILVYGSHSEIDEGDYQFEFNQNTYTLHNSSENVDSLRSKIKTKIFENIEKFIDRFSEIRIFLNCDRSVVVEVSIDTMVISYMMPSIVTAD